MGRKLTTLTDDQRNAVLQVLLMRRDNSVNGLQRTAIRDTAELFNVNPKTISRIWRRAREQLKKGIERPNVSSRKKGACGRKRKDRASERPIPV